MSIHCAYVQTLEPLYTLLNFVVNSCCPLNKFEADLSALHTASESGRESFTSISWISVQCFVAYISFTTCRYLHGFLNGIPTVYRALIGDRSRTVRKKYTPLLLSSASTLKVKPAAASLNALPLTLHVGIRQNPLYEVKFRIEFNDFESDSSECIF